MDYLIAVLFQVESINAHNIHHPHISLYHKERSVYYKLSLSISLYLFFCNEGDSFWSHDPVGALSCTASSSPSRSYPGHEAIATHYDLNTLRWKCVRCIGFVLYTHEGVTAMLRFWYEGHI